jgi:DNA-directed RNA polymerase specialized sigma24 family protein
LLAHHAIDHHRHGPGEKRRPPWRRSARHHAQHIGGYNEEEVAEALGVTTRTVQRDWQKAKMLLQAMLSDSP